MFNLFNKTKVILVNHEGRHKLVTAKICCGRLYAYYYGESDTCELLPQGGVDGVSYIKSWKPVSADSEAFYKQEK